MIVEIQGADYINKGGELMMNAVVQHISSLPGKNAVAAQLRLGSFKDRTQTGLKHLSWAYYEKAPIVGSVIDNLMSWVPKPLRHQFNIVTNSEVQTVLDASGFSYTDQQGAAMIEIMAARTERWKKEGKKIILLPQAFGPFKQKKVRDPFLKILKNADLVFARDKVSYDYLIELAPNQSSKIKIAPDFTNLVKGEIPPNFQIDPRAACIVPNYKMVQKTSQEVKEKYISFLKSCTQYLLDKELKPFVLIHETAGDYDLGLQLQTELGQPLKIVQESNPLYIKGILGSCFVVVGSRFHSLVSTLSQGVPCLGTGWSHKYEMLFEDYNCPECLVSPIDSAEKVHRLLDAIAEEPGRSDLIRRIEAGSAEQKRLSSAMWAEVDKLIAS